MGGLYVEADFGVNRPIHFFKPAKTASLPCPLATPDTAPTRGIGERQVASPGVGARARQAHRLTPDTLPLEAEAIPRGTPSRA